MGKYKGLMLVILLLFLGYLYFMAIDENFRKKVKERNREWEKRVSEFQEQLPQDLAKAHKQARIYNENYNNGFFLDGDYIREGLPENIEHVVSSPIILDYESVRGIKIKGTFVAIWADPRENGFETIPIFEVWNHHDFSKGYRITKEGITEFQYICKYYKRDPWGRQLKQGKWETTNYQYPDIPEDLQVIVDILLDPKRVDL